MLVVIAFLSQKGGVGKTTLALGAAAWLARADIPVALVDADPQHTAVDWAALREETPFPVAAPRLQPKALAAELQRLDAEYRYVIVDGPPRSDALSRAIVIASDLIMIPVEASGASDWASSTTVGQLREAQDLKQVRAAMVLSRHLPRSLISGAIREHMAEHGLPMLHSGVSHRVAQAEALTMGKTVFEWAPRSAAAREIDQLMKEIQDVFEERLFQTETT